MNKSRLAVCGVVVIGLLVAGAVLTASSQEVRPLSPVEVKAIHAAVEKPKPISYLFVKEDFTGDFDSIQANIDKFMRDFKEQKLDMAYEMTTPTAMLVFRGNPEEAKQFHYSIGLTVPQRVEVKEPLSIETLRFRQGVKVAHTGRYQQLKLVHENIVRLQAKKAPHEPARFPVVVELQNDPNRVRADQIKTTMVVPVGPPQKDEH
jgi:predicted transcriptional regulator YdeE